MIKINGIELKQCFIGSTPVKRIMKGDTLIWPIGDSPTITSGSSIPSQNEYSQVSYQIKSTGVESYSATNLPGDLIIDNATGLISGKGAIKGTYTFTVTATNAFGSTSKDFTITFTRILTGAGVYYTPTECGVANTIQVAYNGDTLGSSTVFYDGGTEEKKPAGYYALIASDPIYYYFDGNNNVTHIGTCP